MTNKEKIIQMENIIKKLYVEEGRTKLYISKLLDIDRKVLTNYIKDQKWIQGTKVYISPSNKKFLNKNRKKIKDMLDSNFSINDIAKEIGVDRYYLKRVSELDEVLKKSFEEYHNRRHSKALARIEKLKEKSPVEYDFEDLPGEEWKPIWGHDDLYYASNMGRIKKYVKSYNSFRLIKSFPNVVSGRYYVKIGEDNFLLARLIAHCFCDGYSEENNTVNHIDGDSTNNKAENLDWVSQSINNKKAYEAGRKIAIPYSKNKKFKKIILDSKYEFGSISSIARFLGLSETQISRYISGETSTYHTFEFKY